MESIAYFLFLTTILQKILHIDHLIRRKKFWFTVVYEKRDGIMLDH
jgi:hypothetical protein